MTSRSALVFTATVSISAAVGDKLAFAGVVPEILAERDHAVAVEVASEPIPEVEFVDGHERITELQGRTRSYFVGEDRQSELVTP